MSELQQNASAPSLHEWCQSEEVQAAVREGRPELAALAVHIARGGDGRSYAHKHRLPLAAMRREVEALKQLQQDAHQTAPGEPVTVSEEAPANERPGPLCVDDPEMFFSNDPAVIALAKAVCQRCGLKDPCLEASLALNELQVGIWGGLSPDERRRLK